jgi:hypothetical protein
LDRGATSFHEDRATRLLLLGLMAAGGAAYLVVLLFTRAPHGEVDLDERDQRILREAPGIQSAAIMITLALWTVVLTEKYWAQGSIPIAYPYLILMSALIVHLLALCVGILLGYRRERLRGEG